MQLDLLRAQAQPPAPLPPDSSIRCTDQNSNIIPLNCIPTDRIVLPTRPCPGGVLRHDVLNHGDGQLICKGCLLEMVVLAPEGGFLVGIQVSPHWADEAALRQQVDATLQAVTGMAMEKQFHCQSASLLQVACRHRIAGISDALEVLVQEVQEEASVHSAPSSTQQAPPTKLCHQRRWPSLVQPELSSQQVPVFLPSVDGCPVPPRGATAGGSAMPPSGSGASKNPDACPSSSASCSWMARLTFMVNMLQSAS